MSEKSIQKEKDRKRKYDSRARQSDIEKNIQKEKDKARMSKNRSLKSDLEKQTQNEKNKAGKLKMSALKSEEEKKAHHQKDRERKSANWAMKPAAEKQAQNEKDRVRMLADRALKSDLEKQAQNQKDRARMSLNRSLKSDLEKEAEKQKKREIMSSSRALKSDLEKQAQNQRDRERMSLNRALKSDIEKKTEKEKTRKRMSQNRSLKSLKERFDIKKKDRKRKNMKRLSKSANKTAADRILCFKKSVRYGPIFPCISCEQMMFEKGVSRLERGILDNIKSACGKKDKTLFNRVFKYKLRDLSFQVSFETCFFICHTCKKYLMKGKLPPMSAANNLGLSMVPDDILLTELENNLIGRKILFKKIFLLPISRIAAMKDKLVNVPIEEEDISKTIELLPRTPVDGGLIEVKLKRKASYKNHHRQEYIDPGKLFKALDFLKSAGNPYYQNVLNAEEYRSHCQTNDPEGFELLYGEDLKKNICKSGCAVSYINDESVDEILDLEQYLQLHNNEKEELEYRKNDPVRKFQIDYDASVCLTENFPEAFQSDKVQSEQICVAPGEGKIPENILTSDNWDALAFPLKHPDGKNNLHEKRAVKLSDQYYFVQRIRNKDPRFRNDPSYRFAAQAYLEKKQMQRNINVAYLRGKKTMSDSGNNIYSLQDGFSVFDNTSNTPTYWKKAKYEMMAKLDNEGPFQIFFTLSCADKLWHENVTTVLEENNIKVRYEFDEMGNEKTLIQVANDNIDDWIPLDQYVEYHMHETIHEVIRRNVVTATRNYNNRVKSFIKEIMMDPSNPMLVKHYSAKLEFQGRGAAHNHGVLWIDMKKNGVYDGKRGTSNE